MSSKSWEQWKADGNAAFGHGHYAEAIEAYSEAIALEPTNAVLFSNRAFANLKLDRYGVALEDATAALKMDPRNLKAYYHRAAAFMYLSRFSEALKDYRRVAQLAPSNKEAASKLAACEKVYREALLREAVHVDEAQGRRDALRTMQQIVDGGTVEPTYAGPRLDTVDDDGLAVVNLEFVVALMKWYRDGNHLPIKYMARLLIHATHILEQEPNIVNVAFEASETVTIFGDIHGQYYDLCHILTRIGLPGPGRHVVFNGDFVDRGSWGVEVIATLLALKVAYPKYVHLNRGNHEARAQNQVYSFAPECKEKCGASVMEMFSELFTCLPLGTTLREKVLIVHGGLFVQDGVRVADLQKINRFCEPPTKGLMSDVLWADPQPEPGRLPSKRGVGKSFGPDVTARFCDDNGLLYIVRSHEVQDEGYSLMHDGRCITVFSAPNYCDAAGNRAAVVVVGDDLQPKFETFEAVPHPPGKRYSEGPAY